MNLRLLIIVVLFLVGGLAALLALQWKLGMGTAATSPQEVVVPLGKRLLVAGGRAGLELGSRRDERAEMIVRCSAGERWVSLRTGQTSDEICSVQLRLMSFSTPGGTLATSQAHLEVTWKDNLTAEPAK